MSNTLHQSRLKKAVPKTLRLKLTDKSKSPFDLTGGTVKMIVKQNPSDVDADAKFIVQGTITDGVNGLAEIPLSAANMNLSDGKYYYSILFIDSADTPFVLQEGIFYVEDSLWESFASV